MYYAHPVAGVCVFAFDETAVNCHQIEGGNHIFEKYFKKGLTSHGNTRKGISRIRISNTRELLT